MAVFTGYVALGTGVSAAGVFQEVTGGSYARLAISLTGNVNSGLTQTLSAFAAAAAPVNGMQAYGAFFDASTAGNLIAYWPWNVPVVVGTAFPSTTLNLMMFSAVAAEMFQGGDQFTPGNQLGTMNNQPFVAGTNLITDGSGNITPLTYTVFPTAAGGILFLAPGGKKLAHIDGNGNLVLLGTSTASSAP